MSRTKHMQHRMDQRSISQTMLDITRMFGSEHGDKIIFNKKAIDVALIELSRLKSSMIKMRSSGGMVLVESEESEIIAYGLEGYKRH